METELLLLGKEWWWWMAFISGIVIGRLALVWFKKMRQRKMEEESNKGEA